jgi:hypothetical protein
VTDKLKGLFGGGEKNDDTDEQKAKARDFINRFSQGDPSEGYSKEEAAQHLQTALQKASPETIQRATRQAVENLNPDQRAQFAEMLKQRQAGQGMVQINRTSDGGGTQTGAASGGDGGGLDDILGGLLGGGGAAGGGLGGILGGLLGGASGGSSGGGGGGLGNILGGLLGGGGDQKADSSPGFAQADASGGGGDSLLGGLGDLLDSPIGKTVLAGVAAFAAKEMLDK